VSRGLAEPGIVFAAGALVSSQRGASLRGGPIRLDVTELLQLLGSAARGRRLFFVGAARREERTGDLPLRVPSPSLSLRGGHQSGPHLLTAERRPPHDFERVRLAVENSSARAACGGFVHDIVSAADLVRRH